MNSVTVYLNFEQNRKVVDAKINVGAVATVWCNDKEILARCKAVHLESAKEGESKRILMNAVDVIHAIQKELPQVEVTVVGEPQFIIEYRPPIPKNHLWEGLKLLVLLVLVFFGASFAIMTFNNDVDVTNVLNHMYYLVTGEESEEFQVLQLFYSIGIFVGIMIFYNHISRKRQVADPTPLEVQMRVYEKDVNQAIIVNQGRNEQHDTIDGKAKKE